MDMSLSELRELVMDREAWRAAIHGVAKSRTGLSDWTELNWTELRGCALQQKKLPRWEAHSLQLESSPQSLQLEKGWNAATNTQHKQ